MCMCVHCSAVLTHRWQKSALAYLPLSVSAYSLQQSSLPTLDWYCCLQSPACYWAELVVLIWTPACLMAACCRPLGHLSLNIHIILTVGLSWMVPSWEVRGPFSCGLHVVLHVSYWWSLALWSYSSILGSWRGWCDSPVSLWLGVLRDLETLIDVKWSELFFVWVDHPVDPFTTNILTGKKKEGKRMVSVTFLCVIGRILSQFASTHPFTGNSPHGAHLLESFPPQLPVTFLFSNYIIIVVL